MVIGIIIAAIVGILAGCLLGFTYRKRIAEKEIGGAEEEAKRIINESIKTAESKKREAVLEAKEEIHKSRADLDREIKERCPARRPRTIWSVRLRQRLSTTPQSNCARSIRI